MQNRRKGPAGSRQLVLLCALIAALLFTGCSKEGSVRVTNATEHPVFVSIMQGPEMTILAGEEIVENVKISKGLFPPSEREIEVSGRGIVKNFFSVRLVIENDGEGQVTVEPDAAALVLINLLECSMRNAQVKACDVGQWGGNRLANPVRPEGSTSLRLEPGCYDVRLTSIACPEDPFGREYLGRLLELGKADTIRFRLTGGG
jgi:hypothetical protein